MTRNKGKLRTVIVLLAAVLCMTAFSTVAYAGGGDYYDSELPPVFVLKPGFHHLGNVLLCRAADHHKSPRLAVFCRRAQAGRLKKLLEEPVVHVPVLVFADAAPPRSGIHEFHKSVAPFVSLRRPPAGRPRRGKPFGKKLNQLAV